MTRLGAPKLTLPPETPPPRLLPYHATARRTLGEMSNGNREDLEGPEKAKNCSSGLHRAPPPSKMAHRSDRIRPNTPPLALLRHPAPEPTPTSPSHSEWLRRCPLDLRNDPALPPARRHATGHSRHAPASRSTPDGPCRSAPWRKPPRRRSSSTDPRRPPLADPRQLTATKPHIDADHAHDHAHTIPLHHTILYYTILGLPVAMSMGARHLRGGEVVRNQR